MQYYLSINLNLQFFPLKLIIQLTTDLIDKFSTMNPARNRMWKQDCGPVALFQV